MCQNGIFFRSLAQVQSSCGCERKKCYVKKTNNAATRLPFSGFMSPFEWWEEALEFGVVDTVEIGEPGFMSFGVELPPPPPLPDFPSLFIWESDDEFDTFCWAKRSCLRNFARRFWNQTWKYKKKYLFNILSNAKFYLVFILNVGMYIYKYLFKINFLLCGHSLAFAFASLSAWLCKKKCYFACLLTK